MIGLIASGATWSAFNAQTSNSNNQFNTGTVTITDNDAEAAMFSVTNMRPGTPVSRCIKVTYTGSMPTGVKLYGTSTGTLRGGTAAGQTTLRVDLIDAGTAEYTSPAIPVTVT